MVVKINATVKKLKYNENKIKKDDSVTNNKNIVIMMQQ